MLRQLRPERVAQRARVEHHPGGGDHVGGEPRLAGTVAARQDGTGLDPRMDGEERFDLAGLDAEAADLDLVVDASLELQLAVLALADQVPGAVQAGSRLPAPRMWHEPLGGQVRAVEIAMGEPFAAEVELAALPGRRRLAPPVEHPARGVGQQPSDRHGRRPRGDRPDAVKRREGRALGRAVHVEHLARAVAGQRGGHRPGVGGVAAEHQKAQGGEHLRCLAHRLVEHRRGQVQHVHPLAAEVGGELAGGQHEVAGDHHQRSAAEQGGPDLERRGVEARVGVEGQAVAAGERRVVAAGDEAHDRAVRHRDAFGPPGGARGVDDVGEVFGAEAAGLGRPAGGLFVPVAGIEVDELPGARRLERGQPFPRPGLDQHHRGAGVGEQEGEALVGIGGVQGHVGGPRLEDAQQGGGQQRRTLQGHGDPRAPPDSQGREPACQAARRFVEPAIGPRGAALLDDRRCAGVGGGHGGEQRGQGLVARQPGLRVVELHEHLVPLGGEQQRELVQPLLRRRRSRGQQAGEAAGQTADRGRIEEIAVVLDESGESLRRLLQVEDQIEVGDPAVHRLRAQGEAGKLQAVARRRLQGEQDLEERSALQVALRGHLVDQALEREVLVRIGFEGHVPHPLQQGAEGRPAGQVHAQGEGVDEEADQVFDLAPGAVGDRRADQQVLLARPPPQQGTPDGQEQHERRHLLAAAERRAGGVGRHGQRPHATAQAAPGGPRPVGRQLQAARRAGQTVAPDGELSGQPLFLEDPALPDGVVGVLQRQLRQGRGRAPGEGAVEGRDLAQQDPDGPAVGGDVVQGEDGDVLRRGEPQQHRAQQGTPREVEGAAGLPGQPAGGLGGARGLAESRQVDQRQVRRRALRDFQERPAVAGVEGGAQDLVASHHLGEDRGEDGGVEIPGEAHRARDVVERAPRFEPVDEPEALLGEGEGGLAGARLRRERRQEGAPLRTALLFDARGQGGRGAGLEHGAQGDLHPEGLADPGDEPGGEEGMPAGGEEVVRRAESAAPQEIRPEAGEQLLDRGARRHVGRFRRLVAPVRRRQAAAVDLAARRQGEGGQGYEHLRHHVLGEPEAQALAPAREPGGSVLRGHPGDQPQVSAEVRADQDHRLAHTGEEAEVGLDLAQLDPETA